MSAQDSTDAGAGTAEEAGDADSARLERARNLFRQGVDMARSGNCEGAIAQLEASYAEVPRPNTLYNIARCQEQLFRYDLAVKYYEHYLKTADEDDPDREAVTTALDGLRALIGTIEIESNVPAEVWVGSRRVGAAPGDVLVPAGRHVVEVRRDEYLPVRREVTVAGGERVVVQVTLEPAQKTVEVTKTVQVKQEVTKVEKTGLKPALFWSGLGTTIALAAVGGGFGIKALRLRKEQRAVDPRATTEVERIRDQAKKRALVADIMLGTAGAFAIGTTVVYFLTDFKGKKSNEHAMRIQPEVGLSGGGVSLQGSF